ncbi:hypothetical protein ACLD02_18725 [Alloalcanivorax sp. C16-2]|uniref:hypothetical protein n=1 Tax=Alloalcanivorax TaxID=3020832 RepID=UPI0019346857|nr:hypothetical protein [Alloalcanivorax marinus]MBL7252309.1 hypothetical protein [Alloalcanivorax marinus]
MPRHNMPRLTALAGAVLLSGCAALSSFNDPADRVGDALKAQDYRRALAVIDEADEGHPRHALLMEQREGVLQASREYRDQALDQARALAEREQWQEVHQVLRQARERVVDPEPVTELMEQLDDQREARLRALLSRDYLAEARALLSTPDLDQALLPYQDPRARQARQRRMALREELHRELLAMGNDYAEAGRWPQALEALETAHRLAPDTAAPEALGKARQVLHSARDRARDARDRAHRKEAEALVEGYRESGRLDDLLAARAFLLQHQDPQLDALRDRVESWSRQRFQRAMARGEALYAEGDYQAANRLWRSVAPLDPDNPELLKKLERSRKVLNNLRSLEQ